MKNLIAIFSLLALALPAVACSDEVYGPPLPPIWPSSQFIFSDSFVENLKKAHPLPESEEKPEVVELRPSIPVTKKTRAVRWAATGGIWSGLISNTLNAIWTVGSFCGAWNK